MVRITTHEGRSFTDPGRVKVERNDRTERFYQYLERYEASRRRNGKEGSGSA